MALYEFECHSCELVWEDFYKMSEAPDDVECPSCGGAARRLISKSNIRMRPIFTEGGPSIMDADPHESLGMSGEALEESRKIEADKSQFLREGRGDVSDFAISKSKVEE